VDALRLARRTLLDSRRLDMRALAEELGVNRVTLYRWVGGREQLLVEVLWSMTQYRFDKILAELSDHRGPRVPELLRRWTRITVDAPGIRTFLYGENELAMRLLTLESGGFQPRLLGLVRQCIEEDIAEGRFDSPLPVDELAFAAVRICESYIYLPVITGAPADPDKVYRVLDVLMPGSDTGSTRSKPARSKPARTKPTRTKPTRTETPPTEPASRRSDR